MSVPLRSVRPNFITNNVDVHVFCRRTFFTDYNVMYPRIVTIATTAEQRAVETCEYPANRDKRPFENLYSPE